MCEVDMTRQPGGHLRALALAAMVLVVALPWGRFAWAQGVGSGQAESGKVGLQSSSDSGDATGGARPAAGRLPTDDAVAKPGTNSSEAAANAMSAPASPSGARTLPSDAPARKPHGSGKGPDGSGKGADGSTKDAAGAGGAGGAQSGKAGAGVKDGKKGYEPRGPTLVTGAVGFTYGLTDDSVGGFELGFTYGYRLTDWIWFDSQANFSFGSDCKEILESGVPQGTRCGSVHGFGISLLAGVQWKFYGLWNIPVVPFVRADVGVVFVVTNGPYDGAAFVARGGGGARYHFTPWFSVGGEVAFVVGPVVRNDMPTNFFASVDVLAGAEFTF